jgi:hypothetical protein
LATTNNIEGRNRGILDGIPLSILGDISQWGSRMSPKQASKLAFLLICCTSAAALPSGCDPLATVCMNTYQEPWRGADYPLTSDRGAKKGKEITVALFVSIAPGMGPDCARSEIILASDLAKVLPELAKESKQKLAVIDPVQVNKFAMKTPNFTRMHPNEWGWNLGADYVLTIHLDKMSLYEVQPGTKNLVCAGKAEVIVDAFDVGAGSVEPKYHYVQRFEYPTNSAVDASAISANRFKQEFLERLAIEICGKHTRHKEVAEIGDGK